MRRALAAFLILGSSSFVYPAPPIPDGQLRLAVRQRENGKTGEGVHLLELTCFRGSCTLISVSFNHCAEIVGDNGFSPTVERSSTMDGDLRVRAERGALVVEETGNDMGGSYQTTLRFGYKPDASWITQVTSFSGAFVKKSDILKKVITVEYVPLPEEIQTVKLGCGVRLPGLAR